MYTMEQRVCASHTDAEGRLKLVSAIDMMQDCSQMWLESEPGIARYFEEHGVAQILVSRQVDIQRMPLYGELLTVETRVYGCKNFLGYRNTLIYDAQGLPCILSWSIGAFVHLETGRPEKLPSEVLATGRIDPQVAMEYLGKKINPPESPGETPPPLQVSRNDVDFNRHMNNARYIQAAMEFLPLDFSLSRLRIEYKKAAKYGDPLYPEIIRGQGAIYVLLKDSAPNPDPPDRGEKPRPWAIMEFTPG